MIIGIAGYAQTGKDTFGQFLLEQLPGYRRMAFADPLKEMLRGVKEATGANKEEMRPLYVELGKLGRKIDPYFWIKKLNEQCDSDDIVITDVRYANEAKWVLFNGGSLFYMKRSGFEPANDEERQSIGELLSLYKLYMVYNNGSLEQLRAVAVTVAGGLEKHREGRKVGGNIDA